jgi:phosphoribosylanthranilate isomerase
VTAVGLFVNPGRAFVRQALERVPLQLLQFHGDETERDCAGHGLPWIKAARMRAGVDLVEFSASHPGARGILLDAFVDGYGGGGKVFDWSLIPDGLARPLVLSGGLTPDNVTEAVRRVRPWAVDVSSGVESAKGIKDTRLITAFIAGVRNADG